MIDQTEIEEGLDSACSSGLGHKLFAGAEPRALHDRNKVKAIVVTFLESLQDGHTIQEVLEALR